MGEGEHTWLSRKVPNGFWDSLDNRRTYLQWLGEKLGFISKDDWYKLEGKHFSKENKGTTIYSRFYNDPKLAVKELFPDTTWHPWLFKRAGNGYWKEVENRIKYLKWLEEKLAFSDPQDWYDITRLDFDNNNGGGLLVHAYESTLSRATKELYPNFDWKPWLFKITPRKYFSKMVNRRQYLDWVAEELSHSSRESWYEMTKYDVLIKPGGGFIENYYNGSLSNMLIDVYPEYDWDVSKFVQSPSGYWNDDANVKIHLSRLGEIEGFHNLDDWYKLDQKMLVEHGLGGGLYNRFSGSPIGLLKHIFPDHDWKEFLFSSTPKGWWYHDSNWIVYLDWLKVKLGFDSMEDWYLVTVDDFIRHNGASPLKITGSSPSKIVLKTYPEYDWEVERFYDGKKNQKRLFRIIRDIFPNQIIHFDFKHHEMRFESSNYPMELDIWIPSLNLAFEYQGEQHYDDEDVMKRDEQKRSACAKKSIHLIEIPHTWDSSKEFVLDKIPDRLLSS